MSDAGHGLGIDQVTILIAVGMAMTILALGVVFGGFFAERRLNDRLEDLEARTRSGPRTTATISPGPSVAPNNTTASPVNPLLIPMIWLLRSATTVSARTGWTVPASGADGSLRCRPGGGRPDRAPGRGPGRDCSGRATRRRG